MTSIHKAASGPRTKSAGFLLLAAFLYLIPGPTLPRAAEEAVVSAPSPSPSSPSSLLPRPYALLHLSGLHASRAAFEAWCSAVIPNVGLLAGQAAARKLFSLPLDPAWLGDGPALVGFFDKPSNAAGKTKTEKKPKPAVWDFLRALTRFSPPQARGCVLPVKNKKELWRILAATYESPDGNAAPAGKDAARVFLIPQEIGRPDERLFVVCRDGSAYAGTSPGIVRFLLKYTAAQRAAEKKTAATPPGGFLGRNPVETRRGTAVLHLPLSPWRDRYGLLLGLAVLLGPRMLAEHVPPAQAGNVRAAAREFLHLLVDTKEIEARLSFVAPHAGGREEKNGAGNKAGDHLLRCSLKFLPRAYVPADKHRPARLPAWEKVLRRLPRETLLVLAAPPAPFFGEQGREGKSVAPAFVAVAPGEKYGRLFAFGNRARGAAPLDTAEQRKRAAALNTAAGRRSFAFFRRLLGWRGDGEVGGRFLVAGGKWICAWGPEAEQTVKVLRKLSRATTESGKKAAPVSLAENAAVRRMLARLPRDAEWALLVRPVEVVRFLSARCAAAAETAEETEGADSVGRGIFAGLRAAAAVAAGSCGRTPMICLVLPAGTVRNILRLSGRLHRAGWSWGRLFFPPVK